MKLYSIKKALVKVYSFSILAIIALPTSAFPLVILSGKVMDKNTGEALSGASVLIGNSYLNTLSNAKGAYELKKLKEGTYDFIVSYLGYETLQQKIELTKDTNVSFLLDAKTFLQEEVIVEATRANSKTSASFTQINATEIANQNLGQDLPYLLNLQPSVVTTSDAGAGVGYTGIRIRGSDGTRINTTINGIPLNDAESQISYFVDVPDLLSSVDNIQVQRGVGTSTNGAGAFGGSINIETTKLNTDAYAIIASSAGSFNTLKNTINIGSGLLSNKFSFDGRLSKISSDGFVDRGKSDLQSYYLSGGYYGKNTTLKFITFSGTEKTYQSWNGVPEAKLKGDAEDLLDYIERNNLSLSDAQNIIRSNKRTYNSFTYANQTDNYKQQNFQLHFSQRLLNHFTLTTALHYTKGKGYYEEYKQNQLFEDYQLNNLIIGDDTLYSTDLVRQKWLDNHFYGMTYALQYTQNKKVSATLGGAYNIYDGDHYGKIIWAQNNSNNNTNNKYYDDNGYKKDFNVYAKVNYQPFSKLGFYADVQFRSLDYTFMAYDNLLETSKQNVKMNFLNPKFGITYFLSANKTLYLNYAVANKEPSRDDFIQSSSVSRPSSENLANWEFGYVQKNKRYTYSFNTYYMLYKNQLVLNGKVNDVGEYSRTNVNSSSRLGIEWANTIKVLKNLIWTANATWSKNTIQKYFEYIDNYDSSFQEVKEYKNTAIAFSPDWVASSSLSYSPIKNLDLTLASKYVGEQFLDNTSNTNRKLDAYLVNDFRINYRLHFKEIKEVLFSFMANNFMNEMYESNGYTYNYIYGGKLIVENFYFPQAGRNYMIGITLKFN
jgi:iron complex outermembrane recepter protein